MNIGPFRNSRIERDEILKDSVFPKVLVMEKEKDASVANAWRRSVYFLRHRNFESLQIYYTTNVTYDVSIGSE